MEDNFYFLVSQLTGMWMRPVDILSLSQRRSTRIMQMQRLVELPAMVICQSRQILPLPQLKISGKLFR
jgi:hypothetical protein